MCTSVGIRATRRVTKSVDYNREKEKKKRRLSRCTYITRTIYLTYTVNNAFPSI